MSCCDNDTAFTGASPRYRRALGAVLVINLTLFVVEIVSGQLSGSRALLADALDFAADSGTYALTLAVVGRSLHWRTGAALVKAISLLVMAGVVLVLALARALDPSAPEVPMMGGVALLALAANLASVGLLTRFRDGDANVRSVWLCSRNDAINNLAVFGAAGLVAVTGSGWPDIVVAVGMAALFANSGVTILRQALREWRSTRPGTAAADDSS